MQGRIQIILLIGFTALSVLGNAQNFNDYLRSNEVVLFLRLNHYDTERCNYLLECKTVSLQSDSTEITFRDSKWSVQPTFAASENEGQFNIEIQFECVEGALNDASLSIDLVSQNWSTANYVLMPGSVYNGNRYPFVKSDYPPFVQEFRQLGPNKPILISDQPRLNYKEGASRIQARSGSMSLPSIGYHSQDEEKGIFMWFGQSTPLGDYGVDIEESADRKKAIISLTAPVVREGVQYRGCRLEGKPTDKPANFSKGDRIAIAFKLLFFEHEDVQGLFDQFSKVQETYLHKASISPLMPLSKAYAEIHEKYNRSNWIQKGEQGYYASQTHGDLFQTGWIGGVITLLPLLNGGDALTKERVYQNLEWFFERSETGSNYLPDRIKGGEQATILDYKPIGKLYPLVLARRNAEAAYYLFLLFEELEKKGKSVPVQWKDRVLAAVNAQYDTWAQYGDLGQFINIETGEVVVGNSTSAGVLPAAICKAFNLTGDSSYIEKATDIADYYYTNFIMKGISCGGPGDALQSMDSESSYGLLLGLTELYKLTDQQIWLDRSLEMANQFASWVVAYDFNFPENALHGRMNMQTTGAVYANSQNTCATPGICTYSGKALLELYRFTGDSYYLDLLSVIAKTLPQYLSTKERPIACLEQGWMSERINMNDWLEGIGETNCESNWSEVALMLTYTELPGIYIDLGQERVFSLDHITAKVVKNSKKTMVLELQNPTPYDAHVKVIAEKIQQTDSTAGGMTGKNERVLVKAGEHITYTINKSKN